MKVWVTVVGDWEGTFFGDAVWSTQEAADEFAAKLNRLRGEESVFSEAVVVDALLDTLRGKLG